MRAEDGAAPVQAPERVLDVDVVDAVRELVYERGGIEELRDQVAGIEVDAEALAAPDRVERAPRGREVVGDLCGMDLEGEADSLGVEHVDDVRPALREVL